MQVSEIELSRSKSSPTASSEASRSNLALSVSSDGLTAALLQPNGVHLLDLQGMRHIGHIPAQEVGIVFANQQDSFKPFL